MSTGEELISAIRTRLAQSGLADPIDLKGCPDDEIRTIEQRCGHTLPASYTSFLRAMGHGAGRFLRGSDWTCPKLLQIQQEAKALLQQHKPSRPLSDEAFVFVMHQGYQFLFFECRGDSDPPVYLYLEESSEPQKALPSFSKWLMQCVEDEIDAGA